MKFLRKEKSTKLFLVNFFACCGNFAFSGFYLTNIFVRFAKITQRVFGVLRMKKTFLRKANWKIYKKPLRSLLWMMSSDSNDFSVQHQSNQSNMTCHDIIWFFGFTCLCFCFKYEHFGIFWEYRNSKSQFSIFLDYFIKTSWKLICFQTQIFRHSAFFICTS